MAPFCASMSPFVSMQGPQWFHFEPLNFDFYAVPVPYSAFHSNADADLIRIQLTKIMQMGIRNPAKTILKRISF
jgi:hypothetical protein